MPSTKRAAFEDPTRRAKRSKAATADVDDEQAHTNDDITARNAAKSSLLRLPAEIRNRIWEFSYGNSVISCCGPRSTAGVELPNLFYYNIQQDVDSKGRERFSPPGLVCKQFWFETCPIFLVSTTIELRRPEHFQALAISAPKWLQCVRRIAIVSRHVRLSRALKQWGQCLNSSLVGRFTHLEGVKFELSVFVEDGLLRRPNVMVDREWEKTKLPSIIRAFQQHKLKSSLTSFALIQRKHIQFDEFPDQATTNEAIRTELLKHRPRRVSGRSKGSCAEDEH